MSQKLNDLITRIKTERKFTFIAIAVGAAILFLILSSDPTPVRKKQVAKTANEKAATLAQKEAYDDIITRFQTDLQTLREDNKSAKNESAELKKSMKDYEERTAQIFNQIIKKMSDQPQGQMAAGGAGGLPQPNVNGLPPRPVNVAGGSGGEGMSSGIEDVSLSNQELESFGMDVKQVAPPAPPPAEKVAFIGAGDSVRVKLLAGVNAPTDGTPYPVVFKLVSDVYGPDGSALPIGEARVIAAAQGSLTDSRALFRLTSVNIRLPDGRRKVLKADGWIVGEDGIRGMSGVLIDPIGKAIGGAGFAGFVQGIGQGISNANQSTRTDITTGATASVVTGSVAQFAAGQGLSQSANEWSGIIRERLQNMVPVVQVLSGREATAVFAKNVTISGLFDQLEEDDTGADAVSE
jgi:conjugal transfer pilus assembly protein TraB